MALKKENSDRYFFLSAERGSGGDQRVLDATSFFLSGDAGQIKMTTSALTEQHIVLISYHVKANENSMAASALRLWSSNAWHSGILQALVRLGRGCWLTDPGKLRGWSPEILNCVPRNIMIAISWPSLDDHLQRSHKKELLTCTAWPHLP